MKPVISSSSPPERSLAARWFASGTRAWSCPSLPQNNPSGDTKLPRQGRKSPSDRVDGWHQPRAPTSCIPRAPLGAHKKFPPVPTVSPASRRLSGAEEAPNGRAISNHHLPRARSPWGRSGAGVPVGGRSCAAGAGRFLRTEGFSFVLQDALGVPRLHNSPELLAATRTQHPVNK